jgi:hypothetical protein
VLRNKLEAEAKLSIQEVVRSGKLQLAWSYILGFENANNPFSERREHVKKWKKRASKDCGEKTEINQTARELRAITGC